MMILITPASASTGKAGKPVPQCHSATVPHPPIRGYRNSVGLIRTAA